MRSETDRAAAMILVVEDEAALSDVVQAYLVKAGYATASARSGPEAVEAARTLSPDVIILDLGLPGLDGLEVMRRIRAFSDCYVLITTARSEEVDRLVGLSVGADDYLTKPFSVRELVARVQAVLRRPRADSVTASSDTVRTYGELEIDTAAQEVRLASRPLPLTPTERGLLMTLALSPGQAFSRRQLMEAVWGDSWIGDDHLVDVHIANLRRKLDETAESARFVTTVRGIGYRMGKG
ncbi:response regulator [Brachybacterium vulturis]|uniref:response regulator n=1 Tax=Brachybacterium vulturis TaxID=2017484 RepID=UPI003736E997